MQVEGRHEVATFHFSLTLATGARSRNALKATHRCRALDRCVLTRTIKTYGRPDGIRIWRLLLRAINLSAKFLGNRIRTGLQLPYFLGNRHSSLPLIRPLR